MSLPTLVVAPLVVVILVFFCAIMYFMLNRFCRKSNLTLLSQTENNARIFVSIASYRDRRCAGTIESLYRMAKNPENVYVGLCVQNDEEDAACPGSDFPHRQNIRVYRMKAHEAKGPAYARYYCATLYRDEEYFLQIDSHMEFVQDWDAQLVAQLRASDALLSEGARGAVLTHYPPADMTDDVRRGKVTTHICKGKFEDEGMPSFLSVQRGNAPAPLRTYYLAGGFMFGPGELVRRVPYDPHLEYLFWGEEVLLAARLWTHGYDLFSPAAAVCSHVYERTQDPNFFVDNAKHQGGAHTWQHGQRRAQNRVSHMFGWPQNQAEGLDERDLRKYGMGTDRPVQDYLSKAGIDARQRKVGDHC